LTTSFPKSGKPFYLRIFAHSGLVSWRLVAQEVELFHVKGHVACTAIGKKRSVYPNLFSMMARLPRQSIAQLLFCFTAFKSSFELATFTIYQDFSVGTAI